MSRTLMARKACVSLPGSPRGVYVCLVRTLTETSLTVLLSKPISQRTLAASRYTKPDHIFCSHPTIKMPPVQGNGKAPNIANPNLPPTAPSSKAPSVAGSAAPTESAAVVAKDDPAKAIEKLEIRTKAVNTNNVARVANSHLTTSDAKLHPLVNLRNGKPLEKFPETSAGLAKLTCKFLFLVAVLGLEALVLLYEVRCLYDISSGQRRQHAQCA